MSTWNQHTCILHEIYLHVYYKLLLSVTLPIGKAEIFKKKIYHIKLKNIKYKLQEIP